MPRVLKILKLAAITAAVLLLILVLFGKTMLQFLMHDLTFMGESFDRTVWATALSCTGMEECLDKQIACVRGPMYRDLTKNYLNTGVSKATVIGLIGEPKRIVESNCFDYMPGFCSGFKIDGDYLRVCFDKDENVMNVFHWQS